MIRFLTLILLFLPTIFVHGQSPISDYKILNGYYAWGEKKYVILRTFNQDNQKFYFSVDAESLQTQIIPAKQVNAKLQNWAKLSDELNETPYFKAINQAQKQSYNLQDSGITHGYPQEKGIALTVDLCPSHKPFDRIMITQLLSEFNDIEKPIPLALSVTGLFLKNHQPDIEWLKNLIREKQISITWINHTYHHRFDPKLPLNENFILEKGTNLNDEVMQNEVAMLEQNLLPSVFFRFPGLVSSHEVFEQITAFGLIPIGSDAWLAKGQNAKSGSIVLIHGNGNEPLGIKDFIALLRTKKSEVLQKEWLLYDLRQSIDQEFKQD